MVLAVTEQVIFDLCRHRLVTEQVENDLFCHHCKIRPFQTIVYTSRISNPENDPKLNVHAAEPLNLIFELGFRFRV